MTTPRFLLGITFYCCSVIYGFSQSNDSIDVKYHFDFIISHDSKGTDTVQRIDSLLNLFFYNIGFKNENIEKSPPIKAALGTRFPPYFNINNCFMYGKVIIKNTHEKEGKLQLQKSNIDSLYLFRNFNNIKIYQTNASVIDVNNNKAIFHGTTGQVYFYCGYSKVNELTLNGCVFDNCVIDRGEVNTINFYNSEIGTGDFAIVPSKLPTSINFVNVNITKYIRIDRLDSANTECLISFVNTDFSKLDFDYKNFRLTFLPQYKETYEQKLTTYRKLLNHFDESGAEVSYEKLDKEYKSFKHRYSGSISGIVADWLDFLFWDYRYSMLHVFLSTLTLFAIFFTYNSFRFRALVTKAYPLKDFTDFINETDKQERAMKDSAKAKRIEEKNEIIGRGPRVWYRFVFTAYVFFGLHFFNDRIKIKNSRATLYLYFQNLTFVVIAIMFWRLKIFN